MSNSSNSTKTGSTEKATSSQRPSGSGWQQAPSTPLFRLVNFELYVKQNAFVMFTGLVALSGCLGYMVYLNWNVDKENTYIAIAEDDSLQRRQRTSRWD